MIPVAVRSASSDDESAVSAIIALAFANDPMALAQLQRLRLVGSGRCPLAYSSLPKTAPDADTALLLASICRIAER